MFKKLPFTRSLSLSQQALKKSSKSLLEKAKISDLELRNRVVMAALTRTRSARDGPDRGVPTDLHYEYYTKRGKDAGLIIGESSCIAPEGDAYPGSTPLYNERQAEGWKRIID